MSAVGILVGVGVLYAGIALFERWAPRPWVRRYQRFANRLQRPSMGILPGWCVVETTGRRTGLARQNPVGSRLVGRTLWIVAGDGHHASFVKNLEANPRVRVRRLGRWRAGTASVAAEEDPIRWLLRSNPVNSLFVLLASPRERMLTIRVDLDD